jgi:hypothetical protein
VKKCYNILSYLLDKYSKCFSYEDIEKIKTFLNSKPKEYYTKDFVFIKLNGKVLVYSISEREVEPKETLKIEIPLELQNSEFLIINSPLTPIFMKVRNRIELINLFEDDIKLNNEELICILEEV